MTLRSNFKVTWPMCICKKIAFFQYKFFDLQETWKTSIAHVGHHLGKLFSVNFEWPWAKLRSRDLENLVNFSKFGHRFRKNEKWQRFENYAKSWPLSVSRSEWNIICIYLHKLCKLAVFPKWTLISWQFIENKLVLINLNWNYEHILLFHLIGKYLKRKFEYDLEVKFQGHVTFGHLKKLRHRSFLILKCSSN